MDQNSFLQALQEQMVGLEVETIAFDYAIRLTLFHPENQLLLVIENAFTVQPDGEEPLWYVSPEYGDTDPIMTLWQQAITHVHIHPTLGCLEITFSQGTTLSVKARDDGYESWQLYSNKGLIIVCMGGGSLAIWKPNR